MRRFILVALFALFSVPPLASAEIYLGIGPLDSFSDVKAKFPSAQWEKQNPAWAKSSDALYVLTGFGLTGKIVIKFNDSRPYWNDMLNSPDLNDATRTLSQDFANRSDGDALTVSWVRWVPSSPFSLQRLNSKYGPAEKSGFTDDDYQPYRAWTRKGLTAFLSDDEKNVVRIDYNFTDAETRSAWLAKYKQPPPWEKSKSAKPKQQ